MAKKPAASAKQKKGGTFTRILMLSLALAFVLMFLPTVLFIAFAMLPTIAAYIVDRNPDKYEWICVGGLNFAGCVPFLLRLWTGRHTIEAATGMLTDVFTLMAVFGAAGVGWLIFMTLPPLIGVFMQMKAQRRVANLKATQQRLIQTWGPEVGKTKP